MPTQFTGHMIGETVVGLAVHPSNTRIATGDSKGYIKVGAWGCIGLLCVRMDLHGDAWQRMGLHGAAQGSDYVMQTDATTWALFRLCAGCCVGVVS